MHTRSRSLATLPRRHPHSTRTHRAPLTAPTECNRTRTCDPMYVHQATLHRSGHCGHMASRPMRPCGQEDQALRPRGRPCGQGDQALRPRGRPCGQGDQALRPNLAPHASRTRVRPTHASDPHTYPTLIRVQPSSVSNPRTPPILPRVRPSHTRPVLTRHRSSHASNPQPRPILTRVRPSPASDPHTRMILTRARSVGRGGPMEVP